MVLFSLAGFAVRHFLGIDAALVLGILAGFIVANFVPLKGSCSLKEGGAGGTGHGESSRESLTSDRNSSR